MSVRLVFLGTGSGKPTPSRNVSSVALFREGEMFMFDCGEGTQTQLAKSSLRPGTLEGIFLTHFHGDHVNGLPGLLGTLSLNQREDGLPIFAPPGLRSWFRTLRKVGILTPGFPIRYEEIEKAGTVLQGDGWRLEAHPLNHRVDCWGYAFIEDARPGRFDLDAARALGVPPGPLYGKLQRGETVTLDDGTEVKPEQVLGPARPGLKVAYCCDTVPCDGAIELARGADVLIHESTYPAGDERMAHKRGHSTSADAARCAKEAGAQALILTHFSQKHLRLEEFLKGARKIFPNVHAAHDFFEFEVTRREQ
jgi:ribonuclease Z